MTRSKKFGYLMLVILFLSSWMGFLVITWLAAMAYILGGDLSWLGETVDQCKVSWGLKK